jgi:C4-dicarboxylate-specific signal transduction histidine kinase
MAGIAVTALILAAADSPGSELMLPVRVWTCAAVAATLTGLAWWRRERRIRAHHASQHILHGLAEDIIGAPTPTAIAEKLATVLPSVTQATSVSLYLYQRRTKSLERVPTSAEPEPMAASVDSSPEGLVNAAVVCFRNRTLLHIPDVRRNPLVKIGAKFSLPRSAMLVPLSSQQEMLGVLEVGNARKTGFFGAEEQAEVQHLANQAAAALRLQEREAMRERIFHSEKLAATGRLISGVASELDAPIGNIVKLAAALAAHAEFPPSRADLAKLSGESHRASEIVSRLVSFARDDDPASSIVDINKIASELFRFREPEWKTDGIQAQDRLSTEPAAVLGSRSQIEQVLLNLLVYAESKAAQSPGRTLSIHSSVMAQKVLVEIGYSTSAEEETSGADPFSAASIVGGDALGLGVCQGIVRGNGGEIRFRGRAGLANFELELPLAQSISTGNGARTDARNPPRALTAMLVDTDPATRKQLLAMLTARGHRGVPVAPREAVDLSQRLRFDAVFWVLSPGSASWTEVYDTIRGHVPAFVLVSDGWDSAQAQRLERNQSFLLARPVQEADIDRILAEIEARSRTASA